VGGRQNDASRFVGSVKEAVHRRPTAEIHEKNNVYVITVPARLALATYLVPTGPLTWIMKEDINDGRSQRVHMHKFNEGIDGETRVFGNH